MVTTPGSEPAPLTVSPEEIVIARRQEFLAALRSGRYRQARGSLYRADVNGYCCIGVGCVVLATPIFVLMEDSEAEYLSFELGLGVSHRTAKYLMAMNDGGRLGVTQDAWGLTYIPQLVIRKTNVSRDFKFIARFLEIIWQMTP